MKPDPGHLPVRTIGSSRAQLGRIVATLCAVDRQLGAVRASLGHRSLVPTDIHDHDTVAEAHLRAVGARARSLAVADIIPRSLVDFVS